MNTKKIIQIVVIVLAFAGSGYVLYNGFAGKSPAKNGAPGTSQSGVVSAGTILPYGGAMDFSTLEGNRFKFGSVEYQKVNTSTEVCIPVDSLVHSPEDQVNTNCP